MEGYTEDSRACEAFGGFDSLYPCSALGGNIVGSSGLTCEHGDLIDVGESSVTLAIETSPQIYHQVLCALVEAHFLVFKGGLVLEMWEEFY